MIRRPPRSTQSRSSAASDVYKRQENGFDNGRTVFQRDAFTRACFKPLEDEETFLMTNVAKSTRKGTARTRRNLEKRGVLETDFLCEYTPEIVQQFLDLEASGWKGAGGTALKSQTETKLFLDDMLRRSMPQSNAVVVRLSLDCLLYTSPSPRDATLSRMPSSA